MLKSETGFIYSAVTSNNPSFFTEFKGLLFCFQYFDKFLLFLRGSYLHALTGVKVKAGQLTILEFNILLRGSQLHGILTEGNNTIHF